MENEHTCPVCTVNAYCGSRFDFRSLETELRVEGEFDAADVMREYADAVEADDVLKERLTMRRVREVTAR